MHTQHKMSLIETAINASQIAKIKRMKKLAGRFKKKSICGLSLQKVSDQQNEFCRQFLVCEINQIQKNVADIHLNPKNVVSKSLNMTQIGVNCQVDNFEQSLDKFLVEEVYAKQINKEIVNYIKTSIGMMVRAHWIDSEQIKYVSKKQYQMIDARRLYDDQGWQVQQDHQPIDVDRNLNRNEIIWPTSQNIFEENEVKDQVEDGWEDYQQYMINETINKSNNNLLKDSLNNEVNLPSSLNIVKENKVEDMIEDEQEEDVIEITDKSQEGLPQNGILIKNQVQNEEDIKFKKRRKKAKFDESDEFIPGRDKIKCKKVQPSKINDLPFFVKYREDEFKQIKKYIVNKLKKDSDPTKKLSQKPLVIYGSPGCGKTACIKGVLDELKLKEKIFYINCLEHFNWFKSILKAYGIRCKNNNAKQLFWQVPRKQFSKAILQKVERMHKTPKLIIFDEFEIVFDEIDLYNACELTQKKSCAVIMIGNNSNFSKNMSSKLKSRYGQPMLFPLYSRQTVVQILHQLRPNVSKQLITYCTKKRDSSVDVRMFLDMIDQLSAISKNKREQKKKQLYQEYEKTHISTQFMINELCKSDIVKLFILSVLKRLENVKLDTLRSLTNYQIPTSYFMYAISDLRNSGLVRYWRSVVPGLGITWIQPMQVINSHDVPSVHVLDLIDWYEFEQKKKPTN